MLAHLRVCCETLMRERFLRASDSLLSSGCDWVNWGLFNCSHGPRTSPVWYQVNTEPILPISIPIPVTYKSSSCRRAVSELGFFKTWNVIVPVSKALQDNFCCLNRLQIKQTWQSTGKGSDIFFHSACSGVSFHFQTNYLTQFFKQHAELIETKYRSHLGRTNTSAGIDTVDVWIHTLTSAANTAVTFSGHEGSRNSNKYDITVL